MTRRYQKPAVWKLEHDPRWSPDADPDTHAGASRRLRDAWSALFWEVCYALRIDRLAGWLSRRLR